MLTWSCKSVGTPWDTQPLFMVWLATRWILQSLQTMWVWTEFVKMGGGVR